jgi:molybdopterin converting factor small subunit
MPILARLHGRFRMLAGADEFEIPETARNVGDFVEELERRFGPGISQHLFDPGTNELSPSVIILVNGHSVKMLEGLKTPLRERDAVTIDSLDILEVVGGG